MAATNTGSKKVSAVKGEHEMKLLDVIYGMTREDYLSDLKIPGILLRNIEIIRDIPSKMYSIDEWQYVYLYIVRGPSNCISVSEIKNKLEEYARTQ